MLGEAAAVDVLGVLVVVVVVVVTGAPVLDALL